MNEPSDPREDGDTHLLLASTVCILLAGLGMLPLF